MKKRLGILMAAAAVAALCMGLFGCGGGSVDASGFYGDWNVQSIQTDEADSTVTAEDMAMLNDFGMYVTLTMNEDGTCALNLFDEPTTGEWKATSDTEAVITMEGQDIDVVLSGDTLTLSQLDATMTCVRATADQAADAEAAEGDAAAAEAEAEAVEEEVEELEEGEGKAA